MMIAYFDESGTHDDSPFMSVAGYLFDKEHSLSIDRRWGEALEVAGVEYFHMSDCANGVGQFKPMSLESRDNLARKLIEIIKNNMSFGVAAAISQKTFDNYADENPAIMPTTGTTYTMCAMWCLAAMGQWADRNSYDGPINYFFEAGHKSQGEAKDFLNSVSRNKRLKEMYHYGSHAFCDKKKVQPLQAADILAWEWRKAYMNEYGSQQRPLRASLRSLLERPHGRIYFNEANIAIHCMHLMVYGFRFDDLGFGLQ